jgi:hypothetical protein
MTTTVRSNEECDIFKKHHKDKKEQGKQAVIARSSENIYQ